MDYCKVRKDWTANFMEETPIIPTSAGEEPRAPSSLETEGEGTPQETNTSGEGLPSEVNYKKKFSDSAREVQRLLQEDKLNKERVNELEVKLAEASETSTENPDWDMLTDAEKMLLKKQEQLEKDILDYKEEKAWQKDFSKAKVAFPLLAEKEAEFKEFCYKYPKGVDAETLAKAFLYGKSEVEPPERMGLEKPTSGPRVVQEGMSMEDLERLRTTDEKKYIELIRKGVIKTRNIK